MTSDRNGKIQSNGTTMDSPRNLATVEFPISNHALDSGHNIQYCTFEIVDLLVGIEVGIVQEVLRNQQMTFVPLASKGVRGLINLRGQIVTALDLRSRFGLEPRPAGSSAMNAVIRHNDEVISLLVDRTRDVVEPSPESFEPVPATVAPQIRKLCTGTFKLSGRLLLILDTDKVVDLSAS